MGKFLRHREESDGALVRRFAREHDGEAFAILVGRYADMVYSTCHRILGEAQAPDAVQETFFQLAKSAENIQGSLASWLHRVATRRAVDLVRREASRRNRERSYALDTEGRAGSWSEVESAVDTALDELPDDPRDLLVLHFLQGRNATQIAAAQGLSQSTVSRRLTEALELMRQQLRGQGIQVGLVPLQTLLRHSNQVVPEVVRYGLGKIALAKAVAVKTSAVTAGSALTSVSAVKMAATAVAAITLAAGTTWVASHERLRTEAVTPGKPAVVQQTPTTPLPERAPDQFAGAAPQTPATFVPQPAATPLAAANPSWPPPNRLAKTSPRLKAAPAHVLPVTNAFPASTNTAAILDGPAWLTETGPRKLLPAYPDLERGATNLVMGQPILLPPSPVASPAPSNARLAYPLQAPMPGAPAHPGAVNRPKSAYPN